MWDTSAIISAVAAMAWCVTLVTGLRALSFVSHRQCWCLVALSVVMSFVAVLTALLLIVDPGPDRLQFSLAPAILFAHSLSVTGLHIVITRGLRQA
jgi:hypothetical protein